MEKNPNQLAPKHFIMIPFEDEKFIEDYKKLCDKLEKLLSEKTYIYYNRNN